MNRISAADGVLDRSSDQPTDNNAQRPWLEEAVPLALLTATIAGSFGHVHWTLDLFAHFRWYYFIAALVFAALIWFRAGRRRIAMSALLATMVWNGVLLAPYYLSSPHPAAGATQGISLISLNVYAGNEDPRAVQGYLRSRSADLVVVLEVTERWRRALSELDDVYPHQFVQAREDAFGIGVLSRQPLAERRFVYTSDYGPVSIVARIDTDGGAFEMVATHPLPPIGADYARERDAQLTGVADLVNAAALPCIVVGDLNATPWSAAFRALIRRTGLRDSALGLGVQTTWNAKSPLIRIPIDHVLVASGVNVRQRSTGPDVGSDHLPVEIVLALQ